MKEVKKYYHKKKIPQEKHEVELMDFMKKEYRKKETREEEITRKTQEDEKRKNLDFWTLEAVFSPEVPILNRDFGVAKRTINQVFGNIPCTRCNGSGKWTGDFQVYGLNDYTCWKCWGPGKHILEKPSVRLKKQITAYFKDKQIKYD